MQQEQVWEQQQQEQECEQEQGREGQNDPEQQVGCPGFLLKPRVQNSDETSHPPIERQCEEGA